MTRSACIFDLWNSATAVANTNTLTSSAVPQRQSMGTCGLELILTGSSPSVNVIFKVGRTPDGTFYAPVDQDATDVSTIGSSITSSTYIQFSPKIAPFIKIVVTGTASNGADTTVRAYLTFQEDIR